MARLAVAAGIAGVLTAGAAPALADNAISNYSGNASGQAVLLQVNPSAVLDVKLSRLQSIINSLPLGADKSVSKAIGSTLANPTSPIAVSIDAASAKGVSSDGTLLSDGSASSTAVAVKAESLRDEVALLNQAVKNMPDGTVAALQSVLGPIAASDPTGKLGVALNEVLPSLSHPVTGALGSPTVDLLQRVDASFGQDVTGNNEAYLTTVKQGGLLTPQSDLKLQPLGARAVKADAYAYNAVDNLTLVPTGQLSSLSNAQLAQALRTIETALVAAENGLKSVSSGTPVASVTDPVTGIVFPVVNGTVGTVNNGVTSNVDLTKVNDLIAQVAILDNTLQGLNGLQLNQVVGDNGSNAVSGLSRSGNIVSANGLGQVAHVDVLKINDPTLKSLLGSPELASVDGIKATANVSLDGVHPATQSANGTLVDVKVLGKSLSYYAGLAGQKVALDDILKPGTTCTINIPGASTCQGLQIVVPVANVNADLDSAVKRLNVPAPTLLTVTLRRGAPMVDGSNSKGYGHAQITVLSVDANINCGAISQVTSLLHSVQSQLAAALDIHLAACGLGLTNAAPAAAAHSNAAGTAGVDSATVVPQSLVSASFGYAQATLALDTKHMEINTPGTPGPVPPMTGNDLLILAGVSIAALAAGITLQLRKARA